MIDSVSKANGVEKRGFEQLLPYAQSLGITITPVSFQPLLQKQIGDWLVRHPDGLVETVETKIEETNKYGNLFLEYWSNRKQFTHGWLHTSEAEKLWYFFDREGILCVCSLVELRRWAFGYGDSDNGRIYRYPLRRQGKYEQLNDTWGRCVPIDDLRQQVNGFHIENIRDIPF